MILTQTKIDEILDALRGAKLLQRWSSSNGAGLIISEIHKVTPKGKWAPTLREIAGAALAAGIPEVQKMVDENLRRIQYFDRNPYETGFDSLPVVPVDTISVPFLVKALVKWEKTEVQEAENEREVKVRKAKIAVAAEQLRQRIVNQFDFAFLKGETAAAKYVTCGECPAPAKVLILTHEIPKASILDPRQIEAAWCGENDGHWHFVNRPRLDCSRLEFFYTGLKTIYIKGSSNDDSKS